MREYLFRGKRKDNGEWVYGNFVRGCVDDFAYIVEFGNKELCRNYVEVIPETVGQYTGFTDKNGKKIFEGDIIQFCTGMKLHYIVEFDLGGFMLSRYDKCGEIIDVYNSPCEVIGNIHDDPELRKSVMNK